MSTEYVLAVDCALRKRTVVLLRDQVVCTSVSENDERPHSLALLSAIDAVLTKEKIILSDIQRVIYSIGPGGFTSLRAGLATLTGLFSQASVLFWPVSSLFLRCLSQSLDGTKPVMALIRAGQGKYCVGIWQSKNFSEHLIDREQTVKFLGDFRESAGVICGDGAADFDFVDPSHANDLVLPESFARVYRFAAQQFQPLSQITLNYLQAAV